MAASGVNTFEQVTQMFEYILCRSLVNLFKISLKTLKHLNNSKYKKS